MYPSLPLVLSILLPLTTALPPGFQPPLVLSTDSASASASASTSAGTPSLHLSPSTEATEAVPTEPPAAAPTITSLPMDSTDAAPHTPPSSIISMSLPMDSTDAAPHTPPSPISMSLPMDHTHAAPHAPSSSVLSLPSDDAHSSSSPSSPAPTGSSDIGSGSGTQEEGHSSPKTGFSLNLANQLDAAVHLIARDPVLPVRPPSDPLPDFVPPLPPLPPTKGQPMTPESSSSSLKPVPPESTFPMSSPPFSVGSGAVPTTLYTMVGA